MAVRQDCPKTFTRKCVWKALIAGSAKRKTSAAGSSTIQYRGLVVDLWRLASGGRLNDAYYHTLNVDRLFAVHINWRVIMIQW